MHFTLQTLHGEYVFLFSRRANEAKGKAYYGEGTVTILLDSVTCNGTESRIEMCAHNSWGKHDCENTEDAGVVCEP